MNDQDYIRAAVELADGWSFDELNVRIEGFCQFAHCDYDLDQPLKDALAAQLVRQVDALGDDVCLETGSTGTVRISRGMDMKELAIEFNRDRTMNTIKAIVDSSVLS